MKLFSELPLAAMTVWSKSRRRHAGDDVFSIPSKDHHHQQHEFGGGAGVQRRVTIQPAAPRRGDGARVAAAAR